MPAPVHTRRAACTRFLCQSGRIPLHSYSSADLPHTLHPETLPPIQDRCSIKLRAPGCQELVPGIANRLPGEKARSLPLNTCGLVDDRVDPNPVQTMRMPAARYPPWIEPRQAPVGQTLLFALCLLRNAACSPSISKHHIHRAGRHYCGIPPGIPLRWNGRLRTVAGSIKAILASSRLWRVPVETSERRGV